MKICTECKQEKAYSEFYVYKRSGRNPYLYSKCKDCLKTIRSSEYSKANRSALRSSDYSLVKAKIDEIKNQPCMDCGVTYPPYVMDLDHVRGEKYKNIAKMIGRHSWARIQAEIEKCDLVCSNCHRIRTHNRKENHARSNHT